MTHPSATDVALQVAQQAVTVLAKWAGVTLPPECTCLTDDRVVERVKQNILLWGSKDEPQALRLLFDRVKLDQGQDKVHYWKAEAIANSDPQIPYPQSNPPTQAEQDNLKQQIKDVIPCLPGNWENLSLLMLILEKFGSCLSFIQSDVALIDMVRATAAITAAIVSNSEPTELSLVAGDLSGIQKFIYTISSDGALKSLRARSFYLELVTEEIVQQLLVELDLPRTSVIYAGGGNLYLLAAATKETKDKVNQVRQRLNRWLKDEFQSKVFLALDCLKFNINDVANQNFADHWNKVIGQLNQQKSRKFVDSLSDLLEPRTSNETCRVCHRDDTENLKKLNPREDDSVEACPTCRQMFQLGGKLFGVKTIVRSHRQDLGAGHAVSLQFSKTNLTTPDVYYHLFTTGWKQVVQEADTVFLVNDWTVEHYQFRHFRKVFPLLLGDYGQRSQKDSENQEHQGFITASEMAESAEGIDRVGYLQMDVDNLGRMFAKGLGELHTLPRLAGLSRQMNYFFKVYLNSLAKNRQQNLYGNAEKLTENNRLNLLFIYAGGDDLFVSGSWNEVVDFAFDVYQCFRAYTGENRDITLSAGISLAGEKFPIYQAAAAAKDEENKAKSNNRDSLGLFGQVFKWENWLGKRVIDQETKDYLPQEVIPELLGVLHLVKQLHNKLGDNYSRSFVRNLLLTAQIQEQMIIEKERINKEHSGKSVDEAAIANLKAEQKDIRYFLHLPKIAYTLARLPSNIREQPEFDPIRKSLKSPYNAPYFRAIATWIELLTRSSN